MVVHDNPALRALTEQFVLVRATQMGGVDLATFQFDPFLSWSLFFMNGDKTIYGRYGRAHPKTKRSEKDSNPNPTPEGMQAALRRALEIHTAYAKDPTTVGPTLAGKTGPEPKWRFAEKTPSARKYKRLKRVKPGEGEGCVHCHEVQRTAIDSYVMKGYDLPDSMLWMYPRPHVLGLSLSNEACATVTKVADGSAAAAAGVQPSDEIRAVDGQPLVSIADIQWVLHNAPDAGGDLPLVVRRGSDDVELTLTLPDGWRRTEDWVWRYRVAGYASWMYTGVHFQPHAEGILVEGRSERWFKRPNRDGRQTLAPGDVIVNVDGKAGFDRSGLLAYVMREKRLGSTLKLDIIRKGKREKVSFKLPKKRPEVMGY